MLHGKWYSGRDDLSILGRDIGNEDMYRWHLQIRQDGYAAGYCALEYTGNGWRILNLEYKEKLILDLIMRQTERKLEGLKGQRVYAEGNPDLKDFGFKFINDGLMAADRIKLPKYCKG